MRVEGASRVRLPRRAAPISLSFPLRLFPVLVLLILPNKSITYIQPSSVEATSVRGSESKTRHSGAEGKTSVRNTSPVAWFQRTHILSRAAEAQRLVCAFLLLETTRDVTPPR